ncbi:hypothetical protein [Neotabrizicola sp. VNH66]|uniref:hypothetical protein n=1 Tax=Neotabrizicola sp. VNH66 TaxID=3400918 RepID=UPI003BFF2367
MSINVIAGSKLFIGGQVAYKSKVTVADFSGQIWTEIGPLTALAGVSVEQGMATQEVINQAITQYRKTVKSFPMMENAVLPDKADAGQIAFTTAAATCNPYAFKVEWSTDCESSSVVTMTIASPGVITWNGHGLTAGTAVTFATTGALPTGIVAGTTYYVLSSGLATNSFQIAATPGGTAIVTSGTQSGVHTATAQPIGETDLFFGLPMPSGKAGGAASDVQTKPMNIQPIAQAVSV